MILATSTNGASDFGAGSSGTGKITFEDNTTETYSSINVKDWFQSGEPDASTAQNKLYLIGRNDDAIDTRNFSIYEYKLNITNYKKKIKSISFTNESGGSKPVPVTAGLRCGFRTMPAMSQRITRDSRSLTRKIPKTALAPRISFRSRKRTVSGKPVSVPST